MSDSIPNSEYTIGWIAALFVELVAASQFLDKKHKRQTSGCPNDTNRYTLGSIGPHNVVIACLPMGSIGTASAAVVATHMINSFPNIRLGFMVGIGGGAPRLPSHDIRLGDVVVSSPGNGNGGVLQYDFGKTIQTKEFQLTGFSNQPPTTLLGALNALKAQHIQNGHQFQEKLNQILKKMERAGRIYSRPPRENDRLYRSDCVHPDLEKVASCKKVCGDDPSRLVPRGERDHNEDDPTIHYGLIASANQVMRDALVRDRLANEGVLCFEMEAAGLMNTFPCLVIRGICDYSDSHKNKDWQGYAAMMAAAYAKDLLQHVEPSDVTAERSIKEVMSSLEQKVDNLHHATLSLRDELKARDLERMRGWLCPADASINANRADELRHPGTCTWLLEDPVFQECCAGSRRQLWLHGLAGCGKTVLCAAVLEHLTAPAVDGRLVLKFFFDFRDPKKRTLDDMLRSLVFQTYRWQLTSTGQSASAPPTSGDQPTEKHLQDSFRRMLVAQKEVFVVLDALDESATKGKLLKWIRDMRDRTELSHVRLVFTSRPEPKFEQEMQHLIGEENCIPLDSVKINADICSYVTAKLKDPSDFVTKHLPKHLVDLIISEVGDGADGMFRWAECQLQALAECDGEPAIMEALRNLPRAGDLKDTYDRMMAKIPNDIIGDATRLLQFLVHAIEPLHFSQAMEVVATQVGSPRNFDPNRKPCSLAGLFKYCPGLVLVDRGCLRFAHFSAKQYLLEQADFAYAAASRSVTWACLIHLSLYIRSGFPIREDSLALYAWRYWMYHATAAMNQNGSDDIVEYIAVFFRAPPNQQYSVRSSRIDRRPPLDLAYAWGFDKVVRRLLPSTLAQSEALNKALQPNNLDNVEARKGVKAIIENTLSPLSKSIEVGHSGMVQLLLNAGADVNKGDGNQPPLIAAARLDRHRRDVVRLLLENGADVNASSPEHGTAFRCAAASGNVDISRLLLEHGAEMTTAAYTHLEVLLHAASRKDDAYIVERILESGVDANTRRNNRSPLEVASRHNSLTVIKLLLENGVTANRSSALQLADRYNNAKAARMLRDAGAGAGEDRGKMSATSSKTDGWLAGLKNAFCC